MQRDDDKLSMPGGFKPNTVNASTFSNLTEGDQNNSVTHESSTATPTRVANVTNPNRSAYEVAGPTAGGTQMSYDNQHVEQSSLSDTVKAKATTAATGAAAAGASVIAAAKKLINHNDGNDDHGHHAAKDNALPISNQSAISSGRTRENHGLEFSKQTSAINPLSPSPMDRLPDVDASHNPMTQYNTSGNVSTSSSGGVGHLGTGAAVGAAATGLGATAIGTHYQPMSDTSETKRIPIAQPPSDSLIDRRMDPKAIAATTGTTAAGNSTAMHSSSHHHEPWANRVEELFHIKHHAIPKDSTHLFALTSARVLLRQQEYATEAAGMKAGYKNMLPVRHTTATIATFSAAPEVFERVDYVPDEYLEHFPHHPYEDSFKTGAPVAAAAGAGAYMGSKMMAKAASHENRPVDTTMPQPTEQHTAYLATSTATHQTVSKEHVPVEHPVRTSHHTHNSAFKTEAPVAAAAGTGAYMGSKMTMPSSAERNTTYMPTGTTASGTAPVDNTRQNMTSAASELKFDTRFMGNERSRAVPVTATAAVTGAGVLASSSQNTTQPHRPLGEKIKDALGMHDTSTLTFTDPKTLRPVTEVRTIPVSAETYRRSLTEKVKDVLHLPSEYGPADPMDLELTDPKTLLPMGKKIAAGAVAGATVAGAAGAATAVKSSHDTGVQAPKAADTTALNFTDPKSLRPLTNSRTIPIPAETYKRPLIEKVKDVFHLPTEYGPANTKDLKLTDPKTLRPMGEKIAAGAVAGATVAGAAGAATAVKSSHDTDVQAPKAANATTMATGTANPTALNFTDPKTLRPLTNSRTTPVMAQAQTRPQTENTKEATHLPSEYGPANPRDLKLTDPNTSRPMGEKIAVPAAAAAVGAREATKTTVPVINTPSAPATNISKPTMTTPVSNTPTVTSTMKSSSANPAATATGAAAASAAAMSSRNNNNSITPISAAYSPGGITNRHVDSTNRIAPAIPNSYQGPVPSVRPGEEIVWMKTTTTTTYYTGDGNVDPTIQQQTATSPNAYGTARDGTAYTQNGQNHENTQNRHSSGGFFGRLLGQSNSGDKGKQRL